MGLAATEAMRLWEAGSNRDVLERAVQFACAARQELDLDAVLDLPIGVRDRALLEQYRSWFGHVLDVRAPCPACALDLDLRVKVEDLLSLPAPEVDLVEVPGTSLRFRLLTTRDLLALRGLEDASEARRVLLERLQVDPVEASHLGAEVATSLSDADPLAEVSFRLTCPDCAHTWSAMFEIADFLWGQIEDRAVQILDEICIIARVFHWSESEILSLTPRRRAFYVAAAEG